MKRKDILHIGVAAMALVLLHGTIAVAQESEDIIPGVVLVKFEHGRLAQLSQEIDTADILVPHVRDLLKQYGFRASRKVFRRARPADTIAVSVTGEQVKLKDVSHWYVLRVSDTANIQDLLKKLSESPGVIAAAPGRRYKPFDTFPNDYSFQIGQQWGLYNHASPGHDIHAPRAWDFNRGSNDVIMAVVDGGVDYDHSDLDPGDRSRVISGYDFADGDDDPMDDIPDGQGFANHGTRVAGVIGAITNNNDATGIRGGVAGVMWNCKIMPVKIARTSSPWWDPFGWILSAGDVTDWDIADGIDYARTNGAHVINMSFGGGPYTTFENMISQGDPVRDATKNAYNQGILLVAAMGNNDDNSVKYPAAFPWVTAVGATNQMDNRVTGVGWGSNYGSHIDVAAPGINYYSTSRGQSYEPFGGTSCATPVVSGAAGLIISQSLDRSLNLTNDDVKHLLELSADIVHEMGDYRWTQFHGYGRINIATALSRLNLPYEVTHGTLTGGTVNLVWDSHNHEFYNTGGGLSSGTYYGVKQYRVTWHVDFSTPYEDAPYVWTKERQTNGWDPSNPNLELGWAEAFNVTPSGVDIRTYVYWIGYNSLGQEIGKYFPGNTDNIQASVAYTVVGRRNIVDPTDLACTVPSSDRIRLTWQDNSSNEAGFVIERSIDGINFEVVDTLATNGNGSGTRTYDDNTAQQDITYYYRVVGYAQEFLSGYSNVESQIIPTLTAVTDLSALGQPMHVKLTWTAVANAQGYRIYRNGVVDGTTGLTTYWDEVSSSSDVYTYEVRPYVDLLEGPGAFVSGQAIHLQSLTFAATYPSNQRKLGFDGTAYHFVYESADDIWITTSTDGGATWTNEVRLSDDELQCPHQSPSLCAFQEGGTRYVQVVWTCGEAIYFREWSSATGTWSSPGTFAGLHPYGYAARPVVEHGWIAQDFPVDPAGTSVCLFQRVNPETSPGPYIIPGSSTQACRPSIFAHPTKSSDGCYLVYQDSSSHIKFRKLDYHLGDYVWSTTPSQPNISNGSGRTQNKWPTIVAAGNQIYVAWDGYNASTGKREIVLRRGYTYGDNWAEFTYFGSSSFSCPQPSNFSNAILTTLGPYTMQFGLLWKDANNLIWTSRFDAAVDTWVTRTSAPSPDAIYPLLSNHTDGVTEKIVYSLDAENPPYSFGFTTIPEGAPAPALSSPANHATGISSPVTFQWSCIAGGTSYRLQLDTDPTFLDPLVLDEYGIPGTSYFYDDLLTPSTTYYWHVSAFNGGGDWSPTWRFTAGSISLSWVNSTAATPPACGSSCNPKVSNCRPRLTWTVQGGATGPYDIFRYSCPYYEGDCGGPGTLVVDNHTQTCWVDNTVTVLRPGQTPQTTFYYYVRGNSGSGPQSNKVAVNTIMVWKLSDEEGTIVEEIPAETRLVGNYPNPFNPQTTIRYDLAEPAHVLLTVYDILGQIVAVLVNEDQTAGQKSVELLATNLPSGMYFYRLSVGDTPAEGGYTEVKTMVLMK